MMTNLSPDNEQYVRTLVEAGTFPTARDALDVAVGLLRRREQLRGEVQAGIDQADRGELLPVHAVFERLEKKAANIEQASGFE